MSACQHEWVPARGNILGGLTRDGVPFWRDVWHCKKCDAPQPVTVHFVREEGEQRQLDGALQMDGEWGGAAESTPVNTSDAD